MATMRPNAVVMSASAIPDDTEASEPPPPDAAMPVKAFTIPITVPSSPTNGAVEPVVARMPRSEEHTSELQSQSNLVCRLLLEKKKDIYQQSNRLTITEQH